MRQIQLHSAAVDRNGRYRDAGAVLTVGGPQDLETDLVDTRADELVDQLQAVDVTLPVTDVEPPKAKGKA